MHIATSANRVDTVFGALLPASQNPARMLKHMGLSPECLQFSGQTWYSTPTEKYQTHCPKIMELPLAKIVKAAARDPASIVQIIAIVAEHQGGFLQQHLGQVEGSANAKISSSGKPYHQSLDPWLAHLSGSSANFLTWTVTLGPGLFALIAWVLKQHRWVFMPLLSGLLFNYTFFTSILGDGYYELEHHVILCFSFEALFFALLVNFTALSTRRTS